MKRAKTVGPIQKALLDALEDWDAIEHDYVTFKERVEVVNDDDEPERLIDGYQVGVNEQQRTAFANETAPLIAKAVEEAAKILYIDPADGIEDSRFMQLENVIFHEYFKEVVRELSAVCNATGDDFNHQTTFTLTAEFYPEESQYTVKINIDGGGYGKHSIDLNGRTFPTMLREFQRRLGYTRDAETLLISCG